MKKRKRDTLREKSLQAAWVSIKPGAELLSRRGKHIRVVSPGTWNVEAGPDFRNAELLVNNERRIGDIEVHVQASDWIQHGHQHDPRYKGVILHVVAREDRLPTATRELPDIPVLIIQAKPAQLSGIADAARFPRGKCRAIFDRDCDRELQAFFVNAGKLRLEEKSRMMLNEMLKSGIVNAFCRALFDACGYKQNRKPFGELYSRFVKCFPGTDKKRNYRSLLFGLSGILPDPSTVNLDPAMHDFVREAWSSWWQMQSIQSFPPLPWQCHGLRPLNRPERRIAAAAGLLGKFHQSPFLPLDQVLRERHPARAIVALFRVDDRLWNNYTSFVVRTPQAASVLGKSRAMEITINVALPFLTAYSELHKEAKIAEQALEIYLKLPSPSLNRPLAIAAHRWFIPPSRAKRILKSAAAAQGALHIYRNCCEIRNSNCHNCPLVQSFNKRKSQLFMNPERSANGEAQRGYLIHHSRIQ